MCSMSAGRWAVKSSGSGRDDSGYLYAEALLLMACLNQPQVSPGWSWCAMRCTGNNPARVCASLSAEEESFLDHDLVGDYVVVARIPQFELPMNRSGNIVRDLKSS